MYKSSNKASHSPTMTGGETYTSFQSELGPIDKPQTWGRILQISPQRLRELENHHVL